MYDPSTSSTSKKTTENFQLGYLDGTSTTGVFYLDDVTIPGGPTIKQFQFADASYTSLTHGILGIGPNASEAPVFADGDTIEYADFPWALKDQGFINKAAYSIFLNSEWASSGTLMFGSIDNAKFDGDLLKLAGAFPSRVGIKADSVTIDGTTHTIGTGIEFDSGSQWSRLPKNINDAIALQLEGSLLLGGAQPWVVNCNQPDKYITFNFGNGQKSIQVRYSSFVGTQTPIYNCYATVSYSSDGSDYNNLPIFGDDILRSFYLVFDLEENSLSVAQAKYTSDSDIVPIQ